jgi:hypothetical protein
MAMQNNLPALINHLESNRESSTLSLAYASISDDGVAETAKFVRDNPFVKYLDLRGNNIQAKGAIALANGIKLNRSLRSVNLKWNSVGRDPSGVSALCDALKSNLTIGHVDVRNNRINNIGAKHIAEMLKANTTITHLDISWNDLGVDGGIALLDGLKRNQTLIDCQLSGSKVGEETLHEVAFILRRNRAAAAYKASPNDPGAQAAAAAPETAAIAGGGPGATSQRLANTGAMVAGSGAGVGAGGVEFGATGASFRSARTNNKDDSSLMLRLMMKEREQVLPEDKLFYQQVAEHIDKLLLESSKHKQGRGDGEEREKLSTTGFMDREQRYTREIRTTEENLQKSIADKEKLQRDIAQQTMDLKRLNDENATAIRESISAQEQAMAEEQQLRKELRDIIHEKRELQDKLALGNKDLELLNQENERLRQHVKAFQRDVNEILA